MKASGYRLTPQRLAVTKALVYSDEHPSVETIYGQIRGDFPSTSIATVYNTLECLKSVGEVLELYRIGGSRYDGRKPEPHPHLVCTACGRVEDLDFDLGDAGESIADQSGYSEIQHRLEFTGVCPHCRIGEAKPTDGARSHS